MDDLVAVLIADHRGIERLLTALQSREGSAEHRRALITEVVEGLRRHADVEERLLYPLVRDTLPDGAARADRELSEHAEMERVLADLPAADPADPETDQLTGRLIAQVRNHLQEEEHELLPRLAEQVPEATLRELGERAGRPV